MPLRKTVFANDEIYHVVNRGVAHSPIFLNKIDNKRFVNLINYYRYVEVPLSYSNYLKQSINDRKEINDYLEESNKRHAEILAYCLVGNHFHILLKQRFEKGVSKMLRNIQNSYAKYFNLKNERPGPLFQSRFRAVRIKTDEQLLHVSRYIHLNPSTSYLVRTNDLPSYKWSSFPEYLDTHSSTFVNKEFILAMIGGSDNYKKFVFDQAAYQKKLNGIKHLLLEK